MARRVEYDESPMSDEEAYQKELLHTPYVPDKDQIAREKERIRLARQRPSGRRGRINEPTSGYDLPPVHKYTGDEPLDQYG